MQSDYYRSNILSLFPATEALAYSWIFLGILEDGYRSPLNMNLKSKHTYYPKFYCQFMNLIPK